MTYSHNTTDFALSFTAFLTAIETKPIIKALPQLFLFCEALLAGHGAADMFLVNIFFCDPNTVHRLFLQCRHVSQLNSGNAAFDGSFVRNRPVQGKRLLIVRTGITLISHCRNPRFLFVHTKTDYKAEQHTGRCAKFAVAAVGRRTEHTAPPDII